MPRARQPDIAETERIRRDLTTMQGILHRDPPAARPTAEARTGARVTAAVARITMPALLALVGAAVVVATVLHPAPARAADDPAADFDRRSLALRTALHHDPSLDVVVQQLLEIYQKAERQSELVRLYQQHVRSYPDDANAWSVLGQLLELAGDPQLGPTLAAALERHPDQALLVRLDARQIKRRGDPDAVARLATAIGLTARLRLAAAWADDLVTWALEAGQPGLAHLPLQQLAGRDDGAEHLLEVARRQLRVDDPGHAIVTIDRLPEEGLSGEKRLDAGLMRARVLHALRRHEEARDLLADLLSGVAWDHWRRPEVVDLTMALAGGTGSRAELIDQQREQLRLDPASFTGRLQLAELLHASGRRIEAVELLLDHQADPRLLTLARQWIARLPDAAPLIDLLEQRFREGPADPQLRRQLVRLAWADGRETLARQQLDALIMQAGADQAVAVKLSVARELVADGQLAAATGLLESVLDADPSLMDVRVELLTCLRRLGRDDAIETWLRSPVPDTTTNDDLRLLVEWLVREGRHARALQILAVAGDPDDRGFELGLTEAGLLARVGRPDQAGARLEELRALADTSARYHRWLAVALEAADAGETVPLLAGSEWDRSEGDWPARMRLLERLSAEGYVPDAAALAAAHLRDHPEVIDELAPGDLALAASLVNHGSLPVADRVTMLESVIARHPDQADSWRVLLAALHQENSRADLLAAELERIDFAALTDPETATRAVQLLMASGKRERALHELERMVRQHPAWVEPQILLAEAIDTIARSGNLQGLRRLAAPLLAMARDAALAPELAGTIQQLNLSLVWHDTTAGMETLLADPGQVRRQLDELRAFIDQGSAERLWIDWFEAISWGLSGPDDAAAAAMARFEHRWQSVAADGVATFRGDIILTWSQAAGLVERIVSAGRDGGPARAPLPMPVLDPPPLELAWGFHTIGDQPIIDLLADRDGRWLILTDDQDRLYAVDGAGGRLKWMRQLDILAPPPVEQWTAQLQQFGARHGSAVNFRLSLADGRTTSVTTSMLNILAHTVPRLARRGHNTAVALDHEGERVILAHNGRLQAFCSLVGEPLWSVPLTGRQTIANGLVPSLNLATVIVHEDRVIAFDPSRATLSVHSTDDGRLLWTLALDWLGDPDQNTSLVTTGGAVRSGELVTVWSQAGACRVDLANFSVLWQRRNTAGPPPASGAAGFTGFISRGPVGNVGHVFGTPTTVTLPRSAPTLVVQSGGGWNFGNDPRTMAAFAEGESGAWHLVEPLRWHRFDPWSFVSQPFDIGRGEVPVHIHGSWIVTVNGSGGLAFTNRTTSERHSGSTRLIQSPDELLPLSFATDGPRLFVAGVEGLACFLVNGEMLAHQPWPAAAREFIEPASQLHAAGSGQSITPSVGGWTLQVGSYMRGQNTLRFFNWTGRATPQWLAIQATPSRLLALTPPGAATDLDSASTDSPAPDAPAPTPAP